MTSTRRAIYWGLVAGFLVGGAIASFEIAIADAQIAKGLTNTAHRHLAYWVAAVSLPTAVLLLGLFPGCDLLFRWTGTPRHPGRARGIAFLTLVASATGGVWAWSQPWFPSVREGWGGLYLLTIALLCGGIGAWLYRAMGSRAFPSADRLGRVFDRLYAAPVLALLVLAWLGLVGSAHLRSREAPIDRPHLLFISIDTLRADRLGCYGYERNTSPTLDRLAQQGVRFAHAYAQRALTWPSLSSIMTSLYPKTHGVRRNETPLDRSNVTLPEILKNEGYRTAAFLSNYFHAPNRGFDVKQGWMGDRPVDQAVTDQALAWLEGIDPARERFFAWVHYLNPHSPYDPASPYREMFVSDPSGRFDGSHESLNEIYSKRLELEPRDLAHINALYDAEIRQTDAEVERLLTWLDENQLARDTLIVFTSDHGEELYDHQSYFEHGCSIYDGALRIPWSLRWPGQIPERVVVESQVESIDILPTILELMDLPLRDSFEGRSAVGLWKGRADAPRLAYGEVQEQVFSVRTGEWKYVHNPDAFRPLCVDPERGHFPIERAELYDVQRDPGERQNLAAQHPDVVRELRGQIEGWLSSNPREHEEHELSDEEIERLRALGYLP